MAEKPLMVAGTNVRLLDHQRPPLHYSSSDSDTKSMHYVAQLPKWFRVTYYKDYNDKHATVRLSINCADAAPVSITLQVDPNFCARPLKNNGQSMLDPCYPATQREVLNALIEQLTRQLAILELSQ